MIIYKQLTEKDDFLNVVSSNVIKNNFVTDSTTIESNSCSFNEDFKAFRINDQSGIEKGSLEVKLGYGLVGDTVEIEADVYNLSGETCKFTCDIFNNNNSLIASSGTYSTLSKEGFQKVKIKFIIETEGIVGATIGSYTSSMGDFYIRNLKIKFDTSANYSDSDKIFLSYKIKGSPTGFIVDNGYNLDKADLTISSNQDITVAFKQHFSKPDTKAVGFATNTSVSYPEYKIIVHGEYRNQLNVSIYNTSLQEFVDVNTLKNTTDFWFSILVIGYVK